MPGLSHLHRLLFGTALGALGGSVFASLHLPLPWLIGSLVFVAAARVAGLPAGASRRARQGAFGVVGIALGLYFTPATAALLAREAPLLIGAAFATLLVGAALAPVLAKVAKLDMATAWFASLPGGAADMAMLAEAHGGEPAPVAVAQILRVCFVVIITPNLMVLSGLHGDHETLSAVIPFDPLAFGMVYLASLIAAVLLVRMGVRAGWLLAPLAVSAALTACGVQTSGVPGWLSAGAQVFLGSNLGAGIDRHALSRLRRFVPFAVLEIVALMVLCALVGVGLAWLTGKPLGDMLLGTSPGGVTEMSLTGKGLGLDVAMIVTLHITRIFLVTMLTPPVFRLLHAHRPPPAPGE
jgi:membrane AbrB-like protein